MKMKASDFTELKSTVWLLTFNGHQSEFPSLESIEMYLEEFEKHFNDVPEDYRIYKVEVYESI